MAQNYYDNLYGNLQGISTEIRNRQDQVLAEDSELPDFEAEAKEKRKYLQDKDFALYLDNKYGKNQVEDLDFTMTNVPKSQMQLDREEFDKKLNSFNEANSKVNTLGNTQIGLAWSLRNQDNARAKAMANPFASLEDAKQAFAKAKGDYDSALETEAIKRGCSSDDIKEWQNRKWRGFITGTTEVLNDMKDVAVKSAAFAGGLIGGGALVGSVVPGAGTAAGATSGAIAAKYTAVPVSTLQDTFVKEYGSQLYDYMESHPDISEGEFKKAKKVMGAAALGSAILEMGVAEVALPYVGKLAMNIPGMDKITGKIVGKAVQNSSEKITKFLSTETGKQFLKDYAVLTGAEITQEELQQVMQIIAKDYTNAYGMSELENQMKNAEGVLYKGNIDISNRPKHVNTDGSISTVKTISFETDQGQVLVPSVTKDGKMLTPREAWNYYKETGEHFGVFKDVASANKYADLLHRQQARYIELSTPESVRAELGQTALQTFQGVGLIGAVGASGNIRTNVANRAKAHAQMADNINQKIDNVNTEEGYETTVQTAPVLEGKVTEEVVLTEEQLSDKETSINNRANEIQNVKNKISIAEKKNDTGKIAELETQLSTLEQEQELETMEFMSGAEKSAIKQVGEQIDKDIEKNNEAMDKTQNAIDSLEQKIQQKEAAGKDTTQLKNSLAAKEQTLNALQEKQNSLQDEKATLASGKDIQSVLKGRKVSLPSLAVKKLGEKVTKAETKTKEEVEKERFKSEAALAKERTKSAKESMSKFATGYLQGAQGAVRTAKEIRKAVKKALRQLGLKPEEMKRVQAVADKMIERPDFSAGREELLKEVQKVFEQRERNIQKKRFDTLKKRAKLKKTKNNVQQGKYTASVQEYVDTLFKLAKISTFEAGLNIKNKIESMGISLSSAIEKARGAVNESILNNDQKINGLEASIKRAKELSSSAKTKVKWEGKTNRKINSENLTDNVKQVIGLDEATDVKEYVARCLDFVNMGISFKHLTVEAKTVLTEGSPSAEYTGNAINLYNPGEVLSTVPHEVGHLLDNEISRIIFKNINTYATGNFGPMSKYAKGIMSKINSIVDEEIARLQTIKEYKENKNKVMEGDKKGRTYRQYLENRSECFARVFASMFFKHAKMGSEYLKAYSKEGELINKITLSVPEEVQNKLQSALNELANYENYYAGENGIIANEQEIERLEEENKVLESTIQISKVALEAGVPYDVAEFIQDMDLAAGIEGKERTAEEMKAFNDKVESLLAEGKMAREEQKQAERERIQEERGTVDNLLQENVDRRGGGKKLKSKGFTTALKDLVFDWSSMLNYLFSKETAAKYNTLLEDTKTEAFDNTESKKFYSKTLDSLGFKKISQFESLLGNYLKDEIEVFQNIDDTKVKIKLNKLQCITAWIYNQSNEGAARLEYMFGDDLQTILEKVNEDENAQTIGNVCMEMSQSYYDAIDSIFAKKHGVHLQQRENYFPLLTVPQEQETVDTFLDSMFGHNAHLGTPSFAHTVVHNKAIPLRLENPVMVLGSHIKMVGQYVNKQNKIEDIIRVFKDNQVLNNLIEQNYGKEFYRNYRVMLEDITKPKLLPNTSFQKLIDKMASAYTVNKIAKPATAAKQLISFINYAEDMPTLSFVKYLGKFMANPIGNLRYMMRNEYLQARFASGNSILEFTNALENTPDGVFRNFMDALTFLTRCGDIGAIVIGGYAQVQYLKNEKGLSEREAFDQMVISTVKSQQFTSLSSISNVQRRAKENGVSRMLFAFSNTPFQYVRKTVDAAYAYRRGDITLAQATKIFVIYQMLNPLLYNMATSYSGLKYLLASGLFTDGEGDDEKKEKALNEILSDLGWGVTLGNWDSLFPAVTGPIAEVIRVSAGEKRYPTDKIPLGEETESLLKFIEKISKGIKNEDLELSLEDYLDALKTTQLVGVPSTYLINAVTGTTELADEETRLQGALKIFGVTKKKAKDIASYVE